MTEEITAHLCALLTCSLHAVMSSVNYYSTQTGKYNLLVIYTKSSVGILNSPTLTAPTVIFSRYRPLPLIPLVEGKKMLINNGIFFHY